MEQVEEEEEADSSGETQTDSIMEPNMLWMLCVCSVALISSFTRGHNTLYEGYTLPLSGYHVCPGIEMVPMTTVISYKSAYTQMVPCGRWLPWKTCNVTRYHTMYKIQVIHSEEPVLKCCEGYEQVGSYCALGLNRSSEFTAKPGVCPVHPVSASGLGCHWDTDCPSYQKCCQSDNQTFCVEPQSHANMSSWLNVTISVKTEYRLVNTSRGIFNHTQLLHSVVTGALSCPQVSVYHTHSWSSGRFSTSSCLLLGSAQLLSLTNISDTLQLLLEKIEEVTAVDVRDVDECATPVLRECSSQAYCSNTLGSYNCTCASGSADLQPSRPGTQCTTPSSASSPSSDWNVISFGPLRKPPRQITSTTLSTSTSSTPPATSSTAVFNTSFTFSSPVTPCSTNSILNPVLSIPKITNLWVKNITSSSFKLLWDVPSQFNFTSSLILFQGTHQLGTWVTVHSEWTWTDLQPGVLYTAHITLCMCGYCGNTTELKVKTDAQTLRAVARITNINFTDALLNPNSKEYRMLSEKIINETLHFLPSWILDLVLSGKVIVLITDLSPGSVVVTFTFVFLSDSTQDISSIAYKLMESLQNSTQFTVDPNSIKITDVNECALGEVDCSPWADCVDMFGSYTCACHHGYIDANPERPGRTCRAINVTAYVSSPSTTSPSAVIITTPFNISSNNHNTSTTIDNKIIPSSSSSTSLSSSTFTPVTQGTDVTVNSSAAAPSAIETNKITTTPYTTSITQTIKSTTLTSSVSTPTSTSHTSMPLISQTESITVQCGPGYMIVSVSRSFLETKHISESSLYLGMPSCNLTDGNATHVRLFVAWGMCGTQLRNNSQNSTVQVTLYNTEARLQVPVICTYINSFIISAGYSSSGYDMINNVVEGSGMYQVTVRLLNGTYPLPQNYTLSPNDEIIIEVGLSSNMSQIKVVINKCWANPSSNPAELPNNVFLDNSCPIPGRYTRVLNNGESTHSLLAVNLFNLVEFDLIYLHCQIQICIETITATCHPDCTMVSRLARTSRGANVVGMAKASYGPLLKSHLEVTLQDEVWSMRTIGFILLALGVCVLALGAVAVAMFCRHRTGNYNFRFRPREENFTYHVFNT